MIQLLELLLPLLLTFPPTCSEPPTSRIVYTAINQNADVWIMDPDGSNMQQLTTDPALDWQPAWSPDRKKIAFVSERDGNFEIYVMDADGSNQVRLTDSPARDSKPTWSPDCSRIAFERQVDTDGDWEIYVMDADGSNLHNITNNPAADDRRPDWSPDGKIAYERQSHVWTSNADGSNENELALGGFPDWSPDGSKIVFVSTFDRLSVMDADGANVTGISDTADFSRKEYPNWSPDGAQIVYQTNRSGELNYDIYAIDAGGSNLTRITNNSNPDYHPDW